MLISRKRKRNKTNFFNTKLKSQKTRFMKYLIIPLIFFTNVLAGQSVVASAGESWNNGALTLDWTLGEFAIETYQNNQTILTQGFHQPNYGDVSSSPDLKNEIEFQLFPNPTFGVFVLETHNSIDQNFDVFIHDSNGKLVQHLKARGNGLIDLSQFGNGNYFLTIKNNFGELINSRKITKIN